MTREPTCREVVELVTEYLEGTMAPEDREALERHLEGCQGCRAYIEQVRGAVALSRRPPAETLSPEFQEKLLNAFREFKRE